MRRYSRSTIASTLSLVLILAASACRGREDAAVDTAAGAGAIEPAAPALRVTNIDLGRSMRGDTAIADGTDNFRTTDRTIHAVVKHEGGAAGSTITARWTFEDGQVIDERSETVSPGKDRSHFTVTKGSAWPKGKYTLHVLVDGNEVEKKEFEVK